MLLCCLVPTSIDTVEGCTLNLSGCDPHVTTVRSVDGADLARITLMNFVDTTYEEKDTYTPARPLPDDTYLAVIAIVVENTGDAPLAVRRGDFLGVDTFEGFLMPGDLLPLDTFPDQTTLPDITLQPGEQVEGEVFFAARKTVTIWRIYYRPSPDRFVPLFQVNSGGGGAGLKPVNIIRE